MLAYSDIAPNTRFFFRPSSIGITDEEAVGMFKVGELPTPERRQAVTFAIEMACRSFCLIPPAGRA